MLNNKEKYVDANLYAPDNDISGNEPNSLIYLNLIGCLQIRPRTGKIHIFIKRSLSH